jgi:hypothetical protein
VNSRVVTWVREFLVGRTQRGRLRGQVSKEFKGTSGVPQGSVLGPLKFLVYVNDIWRNIDMIIRLFGNDWIIYRKLTNKMDINNFQKNLDILEEWAVEYGMKIRNGKGKAIRFTTAQVKIPVSTPSVIKNSGSKQL